MEYALYPHLLIVSPLRNVLLLNTRLDCSKGGAARDLKRDKGKKMEQLSLQEPRGSSCTFCKIAQKDIQTNIVFEDEVSLAFLDHRPLLHGHCLLIPKVHYETLVQVPKDLIAPLFGNVQLLARAVEEGLEADGSFVAINTKISQSVPHLHIHIVPRWKKDGLFAKDFLWKRKPYKGEEEIVKIQNTIKDAIARLTT